MFKFTKGILSALAISTLLTMSAVATYAQTTGSVTMTATVSNFVELNSGGAVTLTGNSGGSIITDGTANSPLAVVVNLGELGPSNTNNFVTATVPLKLRSNAGYVLSMSATVTSSGTTASRIVAADVGFGLLERRDVEKYERLSKVLIRPEPADTAGRHADNSSRFAVEGALSHRPRAYIDCVLENAGHGSVVLRCGEQQRINGAHLLSERNPIGGW